VNHLRFVEKRGAVAALEAARGLVDPKGPHKAHHAGQQAGAEKPKVPYAAQISSLGYTLPMQYLIDASVYVFRAYYSMPDDITDADGNPVNAFYGSPSTRA